MTTRIADRVYCPRCAAFTADRLEVTIGGCTVEIIGCTNCGDRR